VELQGFDAAYLDRLRDGDSDTERHFAAYFGELLLIKLRARGRPWHLAEDIRQETFTRVLRAVRSPEGIRKPEGLGAFVNSVCNNILLEYGRSERRHRTPDEPEPVVKDSAPDAQAQLITRERSDIVRRVVDELPPRDRDLLRALFLEEQEKSTICARFGVEPDYLRVLLHRAKGRFRTLYLAREENQARVVPIRDERRPSPRSMEC
jgi:RNA polymerase sigma-70 factor (ECF subfamily)